METHKIVNLLNDYNNESSNFAAENGALLINKIMGNIAEDNH